MGIHDLLSLPGAHYTSLGNDKIGFTYALFHEEYPPIYRRTHG